VKDTKPVFYYPSLVIVVSVFLFINFEATSGQHPSTVSNSNFSSTTTSDAIDKTVRGIATNNIDKLMSETILPVLNNSSTSRIIIAPNNQTNGGTPVSQSNSINSSDIVSYNQNQKDVQMQNEPEPTSANGNTNSPTVITMDPSQQPSIANDARTVADNETILLQFQNPTDVDIVKRLEKIETLIQEYTTRNDVNDTAKSIEEYNNQIINELSKIKSSIGGSSVLPAVIDGVTTPRNVNDTAKSIEEYNNQIINELSKIKSSIGGSSYSSLLSAIISGALAAGIVSAVAVIILLRIYSDNGIKLSEMKLRRRNNSNYT
jgi:hypothetical protein